MDSGGPGGPVTLLIKAPNQKYEDQTIHCSLHWTVGQLKSHIALVYPSRPVSGCWWSSTPSGSWTPDHLRLEGLDGLGVLIQTSREAANAVIIR